MVCYDPVDDGVFMGDGRVFVVTDMLGSLLASWGMDSEEELARLACEDLPPGARVLIDGAEQLGAWSWLRLERRLRPAGVVIIPSHRPGRLPTTHECTTTPELLADLVLRTAEAGPGLPEQRPAEELLAGLGIVAALVLLPAGEAVHAAEHEPVTSVPAAITRVRAGGSRIGSGTNGLHPWSRACRYRVSASTPNR